MIGSATAVATSAAHAINSIAAQTMAARRVFEVDLLKGRLSDSEEQRALNENIIQIQKNTINDLTEQNKLIKIAKEMSNESSSSNHDLKIKINELVRDIDRCIDLLNE